MAGAAAVLSLRFSRERREPVIAAMRDEAMRTAQADVWLGFPPEQLTGLLVQAGLTDVQLSPFAGPLPASEPDAHLIWQLASGRRAPVAV